MQAMESASTPRVADISMQGNHVEIWMNGHFERFQEDQELLLGQADLAELNIGVIKAAMATLTGQFAIAIHHRPSGITYLIADPLAAEPMYHSRDYRYWGFTIRSMLGEGPLISEQGLHESFLYRWLCEDTTMFTDVRRLMPAEIVAIDSRGYADSTQYAHLRYQERDSVHTVSEIADYTDAALGAYLE